MPASHHDALVKLTFPQVEHAAAMLRRMLPPALVARIDWESLALVPGSFVDEALRDRHTDLLFKVRLGHATAFLHVIFEHQSTPDLLMAWRLLRYMTPIWEAHLKEHPTAQKLPAIVPVVLHHSEEGWTSDTRFESLLDVDPETLAAIGDLTPRFRFVLDDISHESGEALRGRAITALGRLVLWCLRNARTPDALIAGLRDWAEVVREVRAAPNGPAALASVWRYILLISRRPREQVVTLLIEAAPDAKEDIVTAGEELIEMGRKEGHKEGRKEGRKEGQAELLLELLRARFGPLSPEVVATVQRADSDRFRVWAERVFQATTLAEVLA